MKFEKDLFLAPIERYLDESIRSTFNPSAPLFEAMRYALLGPGKRLRPLLALASFTGLSNGGPDAFHLAIPPACAIEMIHAYSLIHDDLPCMDDDDWRRGRKAVHREFSEGLALLAGDALQTLSFETLANAPRLPDEMKIQLIRYLSARSGKDGMAEGQAIDILSGESQLSLDALISMHQKKTGDLLSCCLEFGAILANRAEFLKQLRSIGLSLGLAYQLRDDLEDTAPSSASAVAVLGAPHVKILLEETLSKMKKELLRLPDRGESIESLISPLFF